MSTFDDMIAAGAMDALFDVHGDTWTAYTPTYSDTGKGGRTRDALGSGTSITAFLADRDLVLNTKEPDAVAAGDIVVNSRSEQFEVERPIGETRTRWAVKRVTQPFRT
jgi:hypothetical protein